jgi:transposase
MDRSQILLIPHTLEACLPSDHPARQLEMILGSQQVKEALDEWEKEYKGRTGRPPIHPRYLAALYFYGMLNKIRSSRDLEQACATRLDFMWLMRMEKPDHSTIAAFVTKHTEELKAMFKAVIKICIAAGLVQFHLLGTDGTMLWANASVQSVKSEARLKEAEAKIEKYIDELQQEWKANEQRATQPSLFGEMPAEETPDSIRRAEEKKARIQKAIETSQRRVEQSVKGKTHPVASTTDPDSRNCKDKAGRCRPCFNGQAAVDGAHGVIVGAELSDAASDQGKLPVMLDAAEENTGRKHEAVAADAAYADGSALQNAEQRGVITYIPIDAPSEQEQQKIEAAKTRLATGEPLSEEEAKALPKNDKGKLPKECFEYDEATDTFVCPAGRRMSKQFEETAKTTAGFTKRRRYGCEARSDCPYADVCCGGKSKGRTIIRDQYEASRERLRERMKTKEGQDLYAKRAHIAETPFGQIKGNWGTRQFLRRGLEKVEAEWLLLLTTININILMKHWSKVVEVL